MLCRCNPAVDVFCHLSCASEKSLCCWVDILQQQLAVLVGTATSRYWLQCHHQSTQAHELETELACLSVYGQTGHPEAFAATKTGWHHHFFCACVTQESHEEVALVALPTDVQVTCLHVLREETS